MNILEYIEQMGLKDPLDWDNPSVMPDEVSDQEKYREVICSGGGHVWVGLEKDGQFLLLKHKMDSLSGALDSEIDESYLD